MWFEPSPFACNNRQPEQYHPSISAVDPFVCQAPSVGLATVSKVFQCFVMFCKAMLVWLQVCTHTHACSDHTRRFMCSVHLPNTDLLHPKLKLIKFPYNVIEHNHYVTILSNDIIIWNIVISSEMVADLGVESKGLSSPPPHHYVTILRCDIIICNVIMSSEMPSSLCPRLLNCGIHHILVNWNA